MTRTIIPNPGELANLAARVDTLVGPDPVHNNLMRTMRVFDMVRDDLAEKTEISGAMPGEYRIDCRYRRNAWGGSFEPVLS